MAVLTGTNMARKRIKRLIERFYDKLDTYLPTKSKTAQKGCNQMRCQCCNASLNDYESTIRHAITKDFVSLCGVCLKTIDAFIPLQVRNDLLSESDTGNVDTLWDEVEDYIEDTSEDDGLDDYWSER